MKKLTRKNIIILIIAAILVAGTITFILLRTGTDTAERSGAAEQYQSTPDRDASSGAEQASWDWLHQRDFVNKHVDFGTISFPPDGGAVINSDSVNFRESPNMDSAILYTLPKGTEVSVIRTVGTNVLIGKYYGTWCEIKHNEEQGYVLSAFIDADQFPEEKFHKFFEVFYDQSLKKDIVPYNRIRFPLKDTTWVTSIEDAAFYLVEDNEWREGVLANNGVFMHPDLASLDKRVRFIAGTITDTKPMQPIAGGSLTQSFTIMDNRIGVQTGVYNKGIGQLWVFGLYNNKWYLDEIWISIY